MSNKWKYLCHENVGSSIQLFPIYGGEIAIEARYDPDNITQELRFKYSDFMSLLPNLQTAIDEMHSGDFDYYSGRVVVNKLTPIGEEKGWFQILPIEEDVICLQLYSQETQMEVSVVLTIESAELFIKTAMASEKAIA